MKRIKNTPVYEELGKKWRKLVDAALEEKKAYETRWQQRCAIKAWNRMDLGPKIIFGNNKTKGTGMNYIKFVEVDGDRIPYRKWLQNAEFEQVILAA